MNIFLRLQGGSDSVLLSVTPEKIRVLLVPNFLTVRIYIDLEWFVPQRLTAMKFGGLNER